LVNPDQAQDLLLLGTLTKRNLLDIMANFILFEGDVTSGKKVKKICRYQQYRAVNKALAKLVTAKTNIGRGGVIWHTQGSGKSLTMVLLARKIRRTPGLQDATIVVVTDRIDLDNQITATFIRTLATITTPVQAQSVKELAPAENSCTSDHPDHTVQIRRRGRRTSRCSRMSNQASSIARRNSPSCRPNRTSSCSLTKRTAVSTRTWR
jgi:hypothetical protein